MAPTLMAHLVLLTLSCVARVVPLLRPLIQTIWDDFVSCQDLTTAPASVLGITRHSLHQVVDCGQDRVGHESREPQKMMLNCPVIRDTICVPAVCICNELTTWDYKESFMWLLLVSMMPSWELKEDAFHSGRCSSDSSPHSPLSRVLLECGVILLHQPCLYFLYSVALTSESLLTQKGWSLPGLMNS